MIGRVDHGATGIADKATRLNAESLKKSRPNDKSGPQDGGWGANGPVRTSCRSAQWPARRTLSRRLCAHLCHSH
jgi:hypothetical protein